MCSSWPAARRCSLMLAARAKPLIPLSLFLIVAGALADTRTLPVFMLFAIRTVNVNDTSLMFFIAACDTCIRQRLLHQRGHSGQAGETLPPHHGALANVPPTFSEHAPLPIPYLGRNDAHSHIASTQLKIPMTTTISFALIHIISYHTIHIIS